MKTLFLGAAVLLAAISTLAQGQVIFANNAATTITNVMTGLPAPGTSAQDDTQVGLYVGPVGDPVGSLTLVATTNCSSPGRFNGNTRTLSGWTGTVKMQVRAWLANTVYTSYESAVAAALGGDGSVLLGVSDPFEFTLAGGGGTPSSIAVNGLSAIIIGPAASAPAPGVISSSATVLSTNLADGTRNVRLSVDLFPGWSPSVAWFHYGVALPYTGTNGPINLAASGNIVTLAVTQSFSGGLTHHWDVVVTNRFGTGASGDRTFTLGIPGDLDNDGFVSQSELDAVYGHYATNSLRPAFTNVSGLGGTNVTFTLSNAALGAYTVQYSTNLSNWFPLGLASPRYGFTDTNAPGSPTRSYRLSFP